MRRFFYHCLVCMVVLVSVTSVTAQSKRNCLTTNPVGYIFGLFNVNYQFAVGEKSAIGIAPYYWSPWIIDLKIFGGEISYNYYHKEAFNGFWLKPKVGLGGAIWEYDDYSYRMGSLSETKKEEKLFLITPGVTCGYRWAIGSAFTIGVAGGASFVIGEFEGIEFGGFGPEFVFDLGGRF